MTTDISPHFDTAVRIARRRLHWSQEQVDTLSTVEKKNAFVVYVEKRILLPATVEVWYNKIQKTTQTTNR